MKKRLSLAYCSLLALLFMSPFLWALSVDEGIAERIAKTGSVCVEGDACAENLEVASAGAKSAEDVYLSLIHI